MSQVRGHLEVHDIAAVVLHNVQYPSPTVHGLGGFQHLVRSRRGENSPGTTSIQHAHANQADVHGLVATATAGDNSHLTLNWGVGPVHEVGIIMHLDQVGMSSFHAR